MAVGAAQEEGGQQVLHLKAGHDALEPQLQAPRPSQPRAPDHARHRVAPVLPVQLRPRHLFALPLPLLPRHPDRQRRDGRDALVVLHVEEHGDAVREAVQHKQVVKHLQCHRPAQHEVDARALREHLRAGDLEEAELRAEHLHEERAPIQHHEGGLLARRHARSRLELHAGQPHQLARAQVKRLQLPVRAADEGARGRRIDEPRSRHLQVLQRAQLPAGPCEHLQPALAHQHQRVHERPPPPQQPPALRLVLRHKPAAGVHELEHLARRISHHAREIRVRAQRRVQRGPRRSRQRQVQALALPGERIAAKTQIIARNHHHLPCNLVVKRSASMLGGPPDAPARR